MSQLDDQGKAHIIAYASRTLRPSENSMRIYSSAKLELLALKWAVTEKFRDYLLGSKFTVYTDNNPLAYIQTSKLGDPRFDDSASLPCSILTSFIDQARPTKLLMP